MLLTLYVLYSYSRSDWSAQTLRHVSWWTGCNRRCGVFHQKSNCGSYLWQKLAGRGGWVTDILQTSVEPQQLRHSSSGTAPHRGRDNECIHARHHVARGMARQMREHMTVEVRPAAEPEMPLFTVAAWLEAVR